jgi:hypothetical protein
MMERNAQWQNRFSAARSLYFGGEYGAEFGEERRGVHEVGGEEMECFYCSGASVRR